MNKKMTDKLMNFLIGISALVAVIGAYLKISHYPNGEFILGLGFILSIFFSMVEINRLKKIIKKYEKEESKVD
jgi:hypothetical protein